jgi:hypothetical protein
MSMLSSPSVRLSACIRAAYSERIFVETDDESVYENQTRNFKFG